MSENRQVVRQEQKAAREQTVKEPAMRPWVDIFEDQTGITLQADMPGVSRERLEVRVDSDTLTIEGKAEIDMPEGMEALHADIKSTRYESSFTLSRELDCDKIDATMKDGLLTLRIPKREEHQPRKVEVRTTH